MDRKVRIKDGDKCIHCHLCQKRCSFLTKYKADIGDTVKLRELVYHCFLCGICSQVCPIGIDGRGIILDMRRTEVEENNGKCREKGYAMLLAEKKNYIFRNERHMSGRSVLFPGCNFPSFYPQTTKMLTELLSKYGIGVVYDCCGKPIAELGYREDEEAIVQRIDETLKENGIEEVIMVCPNCYAFLKGRLSVRVVNIYDKLQELGAVGKNPVWKSEKKQIFLPCPDRENRELLKAANRYIEWMTGADSGFCPIEGAQCCGLGGVASVKEPELARQMASALSQNEHSVYTYCASCSGNLTRGGCKDVRHVLSEILGVHEKADVRKSMWNRIKTKFI